MHAEPPAPFARVGDQAAGLPRRAGIAEDDVGIDAGRQVRNLETEQVAGHRPLVAAGLPGAIAVARRRRPSEQGEGGPARRGASPRRAERVRAAAVGLRSLLDRHQRDRERGRRRLGAMPDAGAAADGERDLVAGRASVTADPFDADVGLRRRRQEKGDRDEQSRGGQDRRKPFQCGGHMRDTGVGRFEVHRLG